MTLGALFLAVSEAGPSYEREAAEMAVQLLRAQQAVHGRGHPQAVAMLHSVIYWQSKVETGSHPDPIRGYCSDCTLGADRGGFS